MLLAFTYIIFEHFSYPNSHCVWKKGLPTVVAMQLRIRPRPKSEYQLYVTVRCSVTVMITCKLLGNLVNFCTILVKQTTAASL